MKVNKAILSDANSLRRNQRQFDQLISETESLLRLIGEKILETHARGERGFCISITSMLQVTGFSNKESQIYVYSAIIRELEEKNYRARIRFNQNNCTLHIVWNTADDELESDTMMEFLKLRSI